MVETTFIGSPTGDVISHLTPERAFQVLFRVTPDALAGIILFLSLRKQYIIVGFRASYMRDYRQTDGIRIILFR